MEVCVAIGVDIHHCARLDPTASTVSDASSSLLLDMDLIPPSFVLLGFLAWVGADLGQGKRTRTAFEDEGGMWKKKMMTLNLGREKVV